ncbi:putative signal transduction protein [Solidesulfovibrio fructosivorans JJ]]|uniref:Putative signal transduction protein n=1 Tax=Solidesulfovibrio fructosivorans JJ] TaxID=596151 RepID=E1JZ38_SOLFR|nr:HDOD domain-containing protein [Solidesulfovibrio fructosivorans]EFL50321.1 putative signal transduction protein [Solidesulfovibrio fructosivorans JJ]]
MDTVSIDDIKDGMVTAEDVHGQQGVLIIPRGTVLGEEQIRAMRAYGVRDVAMVSDAVQPDDTAARIAASEARCRELLRPRFSGLDLDAPFGRAVFDLAAERAASRALEAGIDWDAPLSEPCLLAPPPEEQLFSATAVDPAGLVSDEVELATLPEVHLRLLDALQSETSSSQELAACIGHDPGLTTKLLGLVNSPHYGSRAPVDSISWAVSMVGRKELTTLAMGLAAVSAFDDIAPELWDMRAFWGHAAACGVYASLLAEDCPGTAPHRVFVGGLLADIGQLVILRKLPAAACRALLLSRTEGLPIAVAETAVLGFDHTAVGRTLLAHWHFPQALTAMVADHLRPDGRPETRETALVHVADILATAWAWPAFSSAPVPALSEAAWDSLGIAPETLAQVAEAGDVRIRDIESVFFAANPLPRH